MKRLRSIFNNTFTLLLLLIIAITTVFVLSKQNLISSEQAVKAQTVVATEETGMVVAQSPLAPPTPTPKPPIDVSKLEVANVKQVPPNPYYYSLPSPDGKYILANKTYQGYQLTKANDGDPSGVTGEWMRVYDLWLVNQENGEEKLISSTATGWNWSPDGSAFSFITPVEKEGTVGALYVFDLSEKTPRKIAEVELILGYSHSYWLPTDEITYIVNNQLWGVQPDGSKVRNLLDFKLEQVRVDKDNKQPVSYTGYVSEYVISPDGKRIAYTLAVPISGNSVDPSQDPNYELWVSGIDGQNPVLVTGDGYVLYWSPDGKWLAYSSSAFPGAEKVVARNLNTYNLETGTNHLIHQPSSAFSYHTDIVWSPNSYVLAFREAQYNEPRTYPLIFANPDGSQQKIFEIPEVITQTSLRMEWPKGEDNLLMTVFSSGMPDKSYSLSLTVSP